MGALGSGGQSGYQGNPFTEIRNRQPPGTSTIHNAVTGQNDTGNFGQNFSGITKAPIVNTLRGNTDLRSTLTTGGLNYASSILGGFKGPANFVSGLFGGNSAPAQWQIDAANGAARQAANENDPMLEQFKKSQAYDSSNKSLDSQEFTDQFAAWKAAQVQSQKQWQNYADTSKQQPGRDATILTGQQVSPNSLLGGR